MYSILGDAFFFDYSLVNNEEPKLIKREALKFFTEFFQLHFYMYRTVPVYSVQELWEDEKMELLLTHSSTSLFMRELEDGGCWEVARELQWNCQPRQVAGPDI
jgi:hypothetical protein